MTKLCGGSAKFATLFCLIILALMWNPVPASGAALPQVYTHQAAIHGWWMSEKLDGVRAYWDGSQLWSKNGLRFSAPPEFVAGLPPFPVEGELWGGHGTFEQTSASVRRREPHPGWLRLRFAIFDVPAHPGRFRARIEEARSWFRRHPCAYAFVVEQLEVTDRAHLEKELRRIEDLGGEGLIVRNPEAFYSSGRSAEILKVKSFDDAEATVIAHLPGKGRNHGRLGALLVRGEDGTEFRIGSGFSDLQRDHPPPPGTIITYKYHGRHRSGIPKFPSFLRVRADHAL